MTTVTVVRLLVTVTMYWVVLGYIKGLSLV